MDEQLNRIEQKLDATYAAVEKMRKYFLWTGIITIAIIVIPLLILPLFVPAFLASQGVGL
ncbi:hypothetical protein K2Q08_03530 [Patescibacteria group bacterium]|nr:hypothetical protein [Patescibacteria group bacterium]